LKNLKRTRETILAILIALQMTVATFPVSAQDVASTRASGSSSSSNTWPKWKWEDGWNSLIPEESTLNDAEKLLGKGVLLKPGSDTYRFQNAVDIRFFSEGDKKIEDIEVLAKAADVPGFPHFPATKNEYEQIYHNAPSVTPTYAPGDPERVLKLRFWKLQIIDPQPEGLKQRYCRF
jgi:hypothetical protein